MIPRFGDAWGQLPAVCLVPAPAISPRTWERFPSTQYEGLVGDLLGMGTPVPGHPAACAAEGCGHAQVWHQHKTRDHKCMVAGCECARLITR